MKKNFFNLNNIKHIFIILILLIFYITISAISYANIVFDDISNNVFRLHIIANSDSYEDQNLKYKVRDNVLTYMNSLISNNMSKYEIINICNKHLNNFKTIALDTIKEEGYNYPVKVLIDVSNFPTKKYGDITLPNGAYDCLKIEIGSAIGQNWWCVMFPPLCFIDATSGILLDTSKSYLNENLSQEELDIINNNEFENNTEIKIKFKIVELVEDIKTNLYTIANK